MKRPIFFIILIAAVLLAWSLWWFSPRKVLARRVTTFLNTLHIPAGTGELSRKMRGQALANCLAPTLSIEAPDALSSDIPEVLTRDEIETSFTAAAQWVKQISLKDEKITAVNFLNKTNATVDIHIDAIVEFPDRRPIDGVLEISTKWTRIGDSPWLLQQAKFEEQAR